MEQSMNSPVRLFYDLHIPENCNHDLAPIVLLHGICSTSFSWNKIMAKLAERTQREVFVIDHRNHGESEWTNENSLALMIKDLEHLLLKLEYQKYIIFGHSMGGRVACGFALNMPDRVELLVIEDSTLTKQEDYPIFKKLFEGFKMISYLPASYTEKELQMMVGKYIKHIFPNLPIIEDACYVPFRKDADGKLQLDFNTDVLQRSIQDESLYSLDLSNSNTTYDGPALFLHGEKSIVPVLEDESIPNYFPNVKFEVISNSVHTPHVESPEECLKIVSGFINSNTQSCVDIL